MSKKADQPRTSDADRSAGEVRADDPKLSLDRLAVLTRRILKMPKEKLDEIRGHSG